MAVGLLFSRFLAIFVFFTFPTHIYILKALSLLQTENEIEKTLIKCKHLKKLKNSYKFECTNILKQNKKI